MNFPTSSIIIRALNEAEHLPDLFAGIQNQLVQPTEIILVDSGSSDETIKIAQDNGANICHIAPKDFSFGRALNLGCAASSSDVLVFVSAHVYPTDEHWLKNLLAPFSDADVVLSYGRQTGDHRSKFSELELLHRWFPDNSVKDQKTPFCNNANCAVRRSWWDKIKYDESLTGLEDMHWAKQALQAGGKLTYRADATIVHIHDEDWQKTRNRYRREAIAHRKIFADQHIGLTSAAALLLTSIGRDYLAAIGQRKLFKNLLSIPAFRSAQYLGTWEGFREREQVTEELRRRFYYPKGFDLKSSKEQS